MTHLIYKMTSHPAYDPEILRKLLVRLGELQDSIAIEEGALALMNVDTSPLGNTDPAILLRNLKSLLKNFGWYGRIGRLNDQLIADRYAIFFLCRVNGKPARKFRELKAIERKLEQDLRLKQLAIEVDPFFRAIDVGVGADNVLEVLQAARESLPRRKPKRQKVRVSRKARKTRARVRRTRANPNKTAPIETFGD